MKRAGSIAERVRSRLARGKSIRLNRTTAGRVARRMLRVQRRNWRQNGLRPRGRGYDWARELIPRELLARAGDDLVARFTVGELARAVKCSERTVFTYLRALARVNGDGMRVEPMKACIRKWAAGGGRGLGSAWYVNVDELEKCLKSLLLRGKRNFAKPSPQMPLFAPPPPTLDKETQAIFERLQAKAAARKSDVERGRSGGENAGASQNRFERRNPDLYPHTPESEKISSSATLRVVGSDALRAAGVKSPPPDARPGERPTKADLRGDRDRIRTLEREVAIEAAEHLRRALMRHLRLWCWYRGLTPRQTRRVCGAVGWASQRCSKASKRRYLIWDAIAWVATASERELARSTGHWLGMQKVIDGFSSRALVQPRA